MRPENNKGLVILYKGKGFLIVFSKLMLLSATNTLFQTSFRKVLGLKPPASSLISLS